MFQFSSISFPLVFGDSFLIEAPCYCLLDFLLLCDSLRSSRNQLLGKIVIWKSKAREGGGYQGTLASRARAHSYTIFFFKKWVFYLEFYEGLYNFMDLGYILIPVRIMPHSKWNLNPSGYRGSHRKPREDYGRYCPASSDITAGGLNILDVIPLITSISPAVQETLL